jgi:hypothetical protein
MQTPPFNKSENPGLAQPSQGTGVFYVSGIRMLTSGPCSGHCRALEKAHHD